MDSGNGGPSVRTPFPSTASSAQRAPCGLVPGLAFSDRVTQDSDTDGIKHSQQPCPGLHFDKKFNTYSWQVRVRGVPGRRHNLARICQRN